MISWDRGASVPSGTSIQRDRFHAATRLSVQAFLPSCCNQQEAPTCGHAYEQRCVHAALAHLPVVWPFPVPADGAPAGTAIAQAVSMEVGSTAANALDLSGHADGGCVDGVEGSKPPAALAELACGCGHGYACAGHRSTRTKTVSS